MDVSSIIKKIACWAGYCLFAGYSAFMTAKSISMSFEIERTWIVFIFVFIVSLVSGVGLSMVIRELQNRFNLSKSKFIIGLILFLPLWIVSFCTNVHYMFMSNEGFGVVSSELGVYKNYVEDVINKNKDSNNEKMQDDLDLCVATINNYISAFTGECDHSIRDGFGPVAVSKLKDIEEYFDRTALQYNDRNDYSDIFHDDNDRGDVGKRGEREVSAIKNKYTLRVLEKLRIREAVIRNHYKRLIPQTKEMEVIKDFINDSVYVVDIPQIRDIATPEVYYLFSKIQLKGNILDKLPITDQITIKNLMKESKTNDVKDINKGEFRYKIYPSSRMFSTLNVWGDMFNDRLPYDMKLLGWILFSLIIDIVAYVLRIFAN